MTKTTKKTKIIAISGKGGVGKTTVSALLIRWLNNSGIKRLLAVDADPDSNLPDALGVAFEKTIGDIREDLFNINLPPGADKRAWIDSKIFEITKETGNFDLIVMG
ncbi:MAG: ATP-binding protein, partial [Candidatus Altiarchaeales archaeon HGW-Altiarchaeales-3]